MRNRLTTQVKYPLNTKTKTDIVPQNMKKQAVLETLQNPFVLGSTTVCVGSLLYLFTLASTFGGGVVALVTMGISGLTTLGLGIWHGIIKNETYVSQKIGELAQARKIEEINNKIIKVTQLEISIKLNLTNDNTDGNTAFKELQTEYSELIELLNTTNNENTLIDLEKMKESAIDIYIQGLDALNLAVETYKQSNSVDTSKLIKENKSLEQQIKTRQERNLNTESLQARITENNETIQILDKYKDEISDLICQSDLCEGAMRKSRISLPDILLHQSKDKFDKTILEMITRIELASDTVNQYKKIGA